MHVPCQQRTVQDMTSSARNTYIDNINSAPPSEMTYIVSSGALNSTHSLAPPLKKSNPLPNYQKIVPHLIKAYQ